MFQNGLIAFQIIKPLQSLGFIFQGTEFDGPSFSFETVERRQPMDGGQWSRMRPFDQDLIDQVPDMIRRVSKIMGESNAERKNAIILLQLALENFHPLIAGLLCVMGMEAIFDSQDRHDFKKKLCSCLGARTLAFPDWNQPTAPPTYTVEEIAIPLYVLRSKLAHGVDLRKAVSDKSTPVDLVTPVELVNFLERRAKSHLLSEAACYLLCQVLRKTI